jgi:hypothetical protein
MIKLTKWINQEHCSIRCIANTDTSLKNRVAFIEKSPRVRINPYDDNKGWLEDSKNWEYGPKGDGQECGKYQPSRDWCDAKLIEMGYELE